MSVLRILTSDVPADLALLRRHALPVDWPALNPSERADVKELAVDMLETMYTSPTCVGLAASQVGATVRLIVMDASHTKTRPEIMFNPEITYRMGHQTCEEGCLSVPGLKKRVKRSKLIRVQWDGIGGERHVGKFRGLDAVVIQHEIDHLDGVLFTDRAG
jgi:peptide deformylase